MRRFSSSFIKLSGRSLNFELHYPGNTTLWMFGSVYAAEYEESYWRRNGKSDRDFSQRVFNFWHADLHVLFRVIEDSYYRFPNVWKTL